MSVNVSLNSTVSGQGPVLILLHGLFGMGQNLSMVARAMSDRFQVHSLDLRNHGRSPHVESMSFTDMAGDVLAYMDANDIAESSILGHSLGGKVAMQAALLSPERVSRLVVADIAPVAYNGHHDDVFAGLRGIDVNQLSTRKDAEVILQQHVHEQGIRQFILKSLVRKSNGKYEWLLNVPALEHCYSQLREGLSASQGFDGPVLFIKGELSNYIQQKHQEVIMSLFPNSKLKIMPKVGHWLHAENPELFNRLVSSFLLGE